MPGRIKNVITAIDYIESHLYEKLDLKQLQELYTIQNITCTACLRGQ